MLNRFSVAATLALLVGCQATSSPEATKQTWNRGYMHALHVAGNKFCGYYVDHEYTRACMKNFSAEARKRGRKFPVVVFLHGCQRFSGEYAAWLADLGYITFSPDSFQRDGRSPHCTSGVSKDLIHLMRQSEITYAREQLRKLDWVDQSRVFLVGMSEGGWAVANHTGAGFKAKIIMSYDCHDRQDRPGTGCFSGPVAGSQPVLNLVGELDHEYGNDLCAVSGRPNSFAFNVPERGHTFLEDEFASEKIKMFLGQFK